MVDMIPQSSRAGNEIAGGRWAGWSARLVGPADLGWSPLVSVDLR
jgi:hypothetical protein